MDNDETQLIRAALLQDLQRPAPRILNNIEAELLIFAGQYVLHYRDEYGEPQIKFLSEESVTAALSNQEVRSGWLPEGVKQWGINAKGTWMVQWIPPAKHTVTLVGKAMPQKPVEIPLPALIFAGVEQTYYVWASSEQTFSPDLPLYHAPLPNLYDDGSICFGSNTPARVSAESFQSAWQLFISSPFNGDLAGGKSVSHTTDVRHQLCTLRKKAAYLTDDLMPWKGYGGQMTLLQAIDRSILQKASSLEEE